MAKISSSYTKRQQVLFVRVSVFGVGGGGGEMGGGGGG